MSNQVSLTRTKFVNLVDNTETFGYRIYDDYDCSYNNFYCQDDLHIKDDLLFLETILDSLDKTAAAIIDFVIEMGSGITIDGNYYEFNSLKEILLPESE